MIVVDTSVAVSAALPGHANHELPLDALPPERTRLLAHVGFETYAVLIRLPQPRRFRPAVALAYIRERFELPPAELEHALERGIVSGAIYDALIALTAKELGATLFSLDRRAARTYDLLGIDYRLIA